MQYSMHTLPTMYRTSILCGLHDKYHIIISVSTLTFVAHKEAKTQSLETVQTLKTYFCSYFLHLYKHDMMPYLEILLYYNN